MPVLFDTLESRQLFAVAPPSDAEQYLIELINRARADPAGTAARFGIGLNAGPTGTAISTGAKQPLAVSGLLSDAAQGQSTFLQETRQLSYVGRRGSLPADRIAEAGYPDDGTLNRFAENITVDLDSAIDRLFARFNIQLDPTNPNSPIQFPPGFSRLDAIQDAVDQIFRNMYIDASTPNRINRTNLFDPNFREVGAGVDIEYLFSRDDNFLFNFGDVGVVDFGRATGNAGGDVFLTGVAFADADADALYSPGEGLGDITVTARRLGDDATFTTSTFFSGGYSLRVPPGTYDVIATGAGLLPGGGLTGIGSVRYGAVTVGATENEKRDFETSQGATTPPVPGPALPPENSAADLTGDITGRVGYDRQGDGRSARFDPVVVGARVYVDNDNDGVLDENERFGLVRANGTYEVTGVGTGQNVIVRVQPPAGYRVSLPDTGFRSVKVDQGRLVRVRPLAITERTVISGRVYRDDNNNGNYDATFDRGLGGSRVYLDSNNDGVWQRETEPSRLSNSQGKYAFRDLLAGTYIVRIIPRVAYLQTEPAVNANPTSPGAYTVVLPAAGLDYLDRDFGLRLIG